MGLKVDKTPEPDMHPRVLNEIAIEIVDALVIIIFKKSIDSRIVPQDWKEAHVTPLFQKGGRMKKENYRPISLASVGEKMLESIIKEGHLNNHDLIGYNQHGFTNGNLV